MEEQDLAWRLFAADYLVWYEPSLLVQHPATLPTRHPEAAQRTWQNRVTAAVKSLPYPILPVYLTSHGIRALRSGLSLAGQLRKLSRDFAQKSLSKPDELDDSGSANKDRQATNLLKVCCHLHRTKLKTKTAKTLKGQRCLSLTMALAQGFMLLPHILIRA